MFSLSYLLNTTPKAAALFIDYGENHSFSDSLRGIKNQKLLKDQEILDNTGASDLSAYVNFAALQQVVSRFKTLISPSILNQDDFLHAMGIQEKLNILKSKTNIPSVKAQLDYEYRFLTDEDKMGKNFKAMYIHKTKDNPVYPFIFEVYQFLNQSN